MKPNAVICYVTPDKFLEWGKASLSTFLYHNPEFDGWLIIADREFSYLHLPLISLKIMEKGYQRLTLSGADSITVEKYERLLWDSDILACHNIPFLWEPIFLRNLHSGNKKYNVRIKSDKHLNNHLFTVTKKEVLEDIVSLCNDNPLNYPTEQVYYNIVAHSGYYKLKWLDTSGVVYNELGRNAIFEDKLIASHLQKGDSVPIYTLPPESRLICGIHWAGGEQNPYKMAYDSLPEILAEKVKKALIQAAATPFNTVNFSELFPTAV